MRVSGNRRPRGGRSNSGNNRSGSSGGRGGSGNNRRSNNGNRNYDSSGPDGKIRGSATQVYDKYVSLARDAQTSSDHVAAENYYQHAEHYYRIMLANNLVKLERTTEQPSGDDDATSQGSTSIPDNAEAAEANVAEKLDKEVVITKAVATEAVTAEIVTTEAPVAEKNDKKEPIVIDISNPDASEVVVPETAEEDTPAVPEHSDEEQTSDEEAKPKSKRRVSRTRGLRRRTSRRSTEDSESDEPQPTE